MESDDPADSMSLRGESGGVLLICGSPLGDSFQLQQICREHLIYCIQVAAPQKMPASRDARGTARQERLNGTPPAKGNGVGPGEREWQRSKRQKRLATGNNMNRIMAVLCNHVKHQNL